MIYASKFRDISIAPIWRHYAKSDSKLKFRLKTVGSILQNPSDASAPNQKYLTPFGKARRAHITLSPSFKNILNLNTGRTKVYSSGENSKLLYSQLSRKVVNPTRFVTRRFLMPLNRDTFDGVRLVGGSAYKLPRSIDLPVMAPHYAPQGLARRDAIAPGKLYHYGARAHTEYAISRDKAEARQNVHVNPAEVKRALDEIMTQQTRRPPAGPTGFDPRLTPAWPGLKIF